VANHPTLQSSSRTPATTTAGRYTYFYYLVKSCTNESDLKYFNVVSDFPVNGVVFDPETGDGFIMFQTGNDEAFASNMATQWTLWKTGKPDIYLVNNRTDRVLQDIVFGALLITLLVIIFWVWRFKHKKHLSAL